jgi:tetratricopeptide (TPR) repeat protein
MKLSRIGIAAAVLVTMITASGCGVINRIRAKNELNEGARAYKQNRYAEAQQHFEKAMELDPSQPNAPLFRARAIHMQYRPGVDTPENRAKAEEAIKSYQEILKKNPNEETAYSAVVALYGQLKEDDKQREWLTQRANLETIPSEKRSDAYTILASKEWNCSFTITELPESKTTVTKPDGKTVIQYKKPKDQKDFEKAQQCVAKGLELVEKAIALNPNNESAWSYKTNLIQEEVKLAEMEGKTDQKEKLAKQYEESLKRANELHEQKKKEKEAEAKKSPAPATS